MATLGYCTYFATTFLRTLAINISKVGVGTAEVFRYGIVKESMKLIKEQPQLPSKRRACVGYVVDITNIAGRSWNLKREDDRRGILKKLIKCKYE